MRTWILLDGQKSLFQYQVGPSLIRVVTQLLSRIHFDIRSVFQGVYDCLIYLNNTGQKVLPMPHIGPYISFMDNVRTFFYF